MRKLLVLLLSFCMLGATVACASDDTEPTTPPTSSSVVTPEPEPEDEEVKGTFGNAGVEKPGEDPGNVGNDHK